MSQLSSAVTAMNSESRFAKAYSDGVKKTEYWEVKFQYAYLREVVGNGNNIGNCEGKGGGGGGSKGNDD